MTCSQTSNKTTKHLRNPADFSLLLLNRRGFFTIFLNLRKGLLKTHSCPLVCRASI
nr:MAG TPA: hypothetical protein [Caudoviricetes sp.]